MKVPEDHVTCEHDDEFNSFVGVHRLTDKAGNVIRYAADIRITCTKCGQPFRFLGLPPGLSSIEPTCSFDGIEARMPITPDKIE